jgi:hypothetical protein
MQKKTKEQSGKLSANPSAITAKEKEANQTAEILRHPF